MTVDRQLLRACANVLAHPWAYTASRVFTRAEGGFSIDPKVMAALRSSSMATTGAWKPGTDSAADALTRDVLLAIEFTGPGEVSRADVAKTILAAEGPLLDWWCEEISRRMAAG